VKDDAERVPLAGADAADSMAHRDAVASTRTLRRSLMDRKDDGVALVEGNDFSA
jgi:hypothetical protein